MDNFLIGLLVCVIIAAALLTSPIWIPLLGVFIAIGVIIGVICLIGFIIRSFT